MSDSIYYVNAPAEQALSVIGGYFQNHGWKVAPTADGLEIERGSLGLTMFAGAMAGKSFHLKLPVVVRTDPSGTTTATFSSSSGTSAVKGGALGLKKARSVHAEESAGLQQALASAGILAGFQQA